MFGVDMATHRLRMDDNLEVLRRALAGDRFEHSGRKVHVTPAPFAPGGPRLAYGGHSLAAARRAGRLGLDLFAEGGAHTLVDAYNEAAAAAGVRPGTAMIPDGSSGTSVFIADDVDRAWLEMGPYLLHDAVTYRQWMGDNHAAASRSEATSVEELHAEHGAYRILTLDEATAQMAAGVPVLLHPLCGGMPPELGWPSVRLAGQASKRQPQGLGAAVILVVDKNDVNRRTGAALSDGLRGEEVAVLSQVAGDAAAVGHDS